MLQWQQWFFISLLWSYVLIQILFLLIWSGFTKEVSQQHKLELLHYLKSFCLYLCCYSELERKTSDMFSLKGERLGCRCVADELGAWRPRGEEVERTFLEWHEEAWAWLLGALSSPASPGGQPGGHVHLSHLLCSVCVIVMRKFSSGWWWAHVEMKAVGQLLACPHGVTWQQSSGLNC